MPDALTYQFIVRARPLAQAAAEFQMHSFDEVGSETEAPRFSALLYLKGEEGYSEDRKLVAMGRIGDQRQVIRFVLPPLAQPLTALRFDPADRPGFLHLFALRLVSSDGDLIWQWSGDAAALLRGSERQILLRTPWFFQAGAALLLTGEDPQFELPLQPEHLQACRTGAVFEAELGWPMSADYALFVDELTRRETRIDALQMRLARLDGERLELEQRAAQLDQAIDRGEQAAAERDRLAAEHDRLAAEHDRLAAQHDRLVAEHDRLVAEHDRLVAERDGLVPEVEKLRSEVEAFRGENMTLHKEVDTLAQRYLGVSQQAQSAGAEAATLREEAHALRERVAAMKAGLEQQRTVNDAQSRQLDLAHGRLREIESSFPFKLVAPLVRGRGRIEAAEPAFADNSGDASASDLTDGTDIVVPVYKGLEETRTCLESVLAGTSVTPFRLVIVNDASPEPEITAYLHELQGRDSRVHLLENPVNVGFVVSVNRALQECSERDVVLLNSDTEVAGDWLDRLRRAAASDRRAATVTPFSNSAEICSYPRMCEDNPLPTDLDTAGLDRLFAAANAERVIEIPTAVGFCMFIRRRCLHQIGPFDTEHFGRGYGEENDFCMRARKAGWRHLLAMDVFVHHAGGVSFGEEKARRVQQAQEVLSRLHPEYHVLVRQHLADDPARVARLAVDVARLRASALPSVLCVLHNAVGGGTERHVRELADSLRGIANLLALRPSPGGETLVEWISAGEALQLGFRLPDEYEELVAALRSLGVAHVHYHHLLGHSPGVWGLPKSLSVAHDFTAHDFYSVCPQITLTDYSSRYCGERGPEQCRGCLQRSPAPGGVSIETWRDGYRPLLEHARFVFAPSHDAAVRIQRYFPNANVTRVPHQDMPDVLPEPAPQPMAGDRPLRIVVLGALSPIKGADVLEATAIEAARRGLCLEFHLLGFAYRSLQKHPKARLTVHGQYEESELPELLDWLKPDVAWFPALWPETYSYTLSACLKAGLPVVAPDVGAFAERLHGRAWTWLCPWDRMPSDWASFFARLHVDHFMPASKPENAAGIAAVADRFCYRRDYLRNVGLPVLAPSLTHEFLARHLPGRATIAVARQSKRAFLRLAVKLRHAPMLRGLVRRVPLRWQTRVKVWLST